jgi:hypothetical protein
VKFEHCEKEEVPEVLPKAKSRKIKLPSKYFDYDNE